MKTHHLKRLSLFVGVTALSLAFSPLTYAQSAAPNTKTDDSNAANQSSSTSTAPDAGAVNRSDARDTNGSLDKNPSTAPTDSSITSGTKAPNGDITPPTSENAKIDAARTGANTSATASAANNEKSSVPSDKSFLERAAQGGMTEVQLGQLAQEKASSSEIKKYGSHMAADHANANAELKTLAQQKGVTVPDQLDAHHQATIDHFKTLSGPAFDKAYVNAMVKDHEKTLSDFQTEANKGKDADVQSFASKTLPTLKEHLTEIKGIQSKM